MRTLLFIVTSLLVFSGCGSKPPAYEWKANAQSYFERYQKMMLSGDQGAADYYFKAALKEAKKSATLESVATLYVGKCAMQKAMFEETQCASYEKLNGLLDAPKLSAYKAMLLGETISQSDLLGKYEVFYEALNQGRDILESVQKLENLYSQAVAMALVKQKGRLTKEMVAWMIDQASKASMKALMLEWKKVWVTMDIDPLEAQKEKEVIEMLSL